MEKNIIKNPLLEKRMGIYLSKTDSLCYTSKTKRKKCKSIIHQKYLKESEKRRQDT